jgi:DNA-binding CsgD family transcriptional regulator
VRAELALAKREADAALQILDSLMSFTANIERHGLSGVPRLAHLRGEALLMLKRLDEAELVLHEARDGAIAQGRKPLLWRIHISLGQVYLAQKRRADAEREFAQAREIIQDLASNVPDAPMHDNFYQRALAMIPAVPRPTARQAAKSAYDGLTARERQVAALIAQGKSNREIAEALVITERTTERHVTNILSKLGVGARTQIAAWAVEKGLARARE